MSVMLYSQMPFFDSLNNPLKSGITVPKEAFIDNINNVSDSITLQVSGDAADTISLEVYGCTRIYDKDGKTLSDADKPWTKLALFNLQNFKKSEGVIDSLGIYSIPISGILSVKFNIVSLSSTNGIIIVGAMK